MICINCFHTKTNVTNSRPHKKSSATWRRRQCPNCNQLFTTYERPAFDESTLVLAEDGSTSRFSLGKLALSVSAAFAHDPRAAQYDALPLAETIEQLLIREVPEPSTHDIAAFAHTVLRRFDEIAAVQYAAQHHLVTAARKRGRPSIKPFSL